MAWIELHQSVWDHRKTLLLADALEIDELYAAAHMAKLWCWALDSAEDGDLTGVPFRIIARGAGWKGDPAAFVQAAIEAGYIDRDGEQLLLHDWPDYAGRLVEGRQQAREDGARGNHERWHVRRGKFDPKCAYCVAERRDNAGRRAPASGGESGGDIGTRSGGESHHTIPDHTVPDVDDDADTRARAREAASAPDTEPEPEGKSEALQLLQTDLAHWHGTERIRASLTDFAEEMSWPVVVLAMERTIEGSPTKAWTYCRRILSHWSERKVRSPADVAALDAAFEAQRQVAAGAGTGRAGPGKRRVPQGMAALAELYEQARADEEGQPP